MDNMGPYISQRKHMVRQMVAVVEPEYVISVDT